VNLYVHFPFCESRCAYCALKARAGVSPAVRRDYCKRIADELAARRDEVYETVYFGGGSPGSCDLDPILRVLCGRFAHDAEFTVELHPRDVTSSRLALLRAGGVNRVSLGVQSLDDATLDAMRRGHTANQAEVAFRALKNVFPNAGFDLIAGYPGVSDASWRRTLDRACALAPAHVSCYTLIREPHTMLDLAVRRGQLDLPSDDVALDHFAWACEAFASVGLVRYEVSNFARPGYVCRHNLAVWRGADYVGLGDGAHGRLGLRRTVGEGSAYRVTTCTPEADARERALFALRLAEGLDLAGIVRRQPLLAHCVSVWRDTLRSLISSGIVHASAPDRYALTARGMEVCDAVLAELM